VKYGFVRTQARNFPVVVLCRVLEVSVSGYYAWSRRPESSRSREDRRLSVEIRSIHEKSKHRYGSPRVHDELTEGGERCSRKRVARLMTQEGLRAREPRKFRRTTDSGHAHPVAPNHLDRRFNVAHPNRVWVGDMTYVWTTEGWLYLSVLMDLCSRRIVGWSTSDRISQELCLQSLEKALYERKPPRGLLHHTDRGSQYASSAYRLKLAEHGLEQSMSRKGNCWDNAPAESFFSTLKSELWTEAIPLTREQAHRDLFEYIEVFYNRERRHSALGYQSPARHEASRELTKGGRIVESAGSAEIADAIPAAPWKTLRVSHSSHNAGGG